MITSKKYTHVKKVAFCLDCKRELGSGERVLTYTTKKDDRYERHHLCLDCEKYYKRKDPNL